MKKLACVLLALCLPSAAQAQTCFSGRCSPVRQAPSYIAPVVPSVDLGRLEATTERIAAEQRYQTHVAYMQLSELQKITMLMSLGAARESARDAYRLSLPDPRTIERAGPLPDPRTIERAPPLPDPREIERASPLPDPRAINREAPLPDPRMVPRAEPFPSSPSGVPPAGSLGLTTHVPWPQVSRTSIRKVGK